MFGVYQDARGREAVDVTGCAGSEAERTPDRQRALRGAVARIRSHLGVLESNKAWTFLLHDVCGYDLREIAEITEVSVVAAQGRLSRGRRELLARLREDPELHELLEETGLEVSR